MSKLIHFDKSLSPRQGFDPYFHGNDLRLGETRNIAGLTVQSYKALWYDTPLFPKVLEPVVFIPRYGWLHGDWFDGPIVLVTREGTNLLASAGPSVLVSISPSQLSNLKPVSYDDAPHPWLMSLTEAMRCHNVEDGLTLKLSSWSVADAAALFCLRRAFPGLDFAVDGEVLPAFRGFLKNLGIRFGRGRSGFQTSCLRPLNELKPTIPRESAAAIMGLYPALLRQKNI